MPERVRQPGKKRKRPAKPKPAAAVAVTRPPREPDEFFRHVLALTNHRAEIRTMVAAELGRLRPSRRGAGPGLSPGAVRQAYLKALQTWQSAASARLEDLKARRTPGGARGRRLSSSHEPEIRKLARRLILGLSKNAARISTLEGAQRRWHAAAKAAREGVRLRREGAREVLGEPLRPDARLHLKSAHATFMVEGNSPRVRKELKDAAAAMPRSRGLAYWLARYEIMAGNYGAALEAASRARDYAPVRHTIMPLLDPESAKAPWLSWPCNFYTYRYTQAETSELLAMQEVLAALSSNPELEATWTSFGIPASAINQLRDRAVDGSQAIASLLLWNQANLDMARGKSASAARNYEDCQRAIVDYFARRYPNLSLSTPLPPDESSSDPAPGQQLDNALEQLAGALIRYDAPTRHIWTFFRERYMSLTLEELHKHDWRRPKVVPLAYEFAKPLPDYGDSTDFATALARMLIQMSLLKALQTSGDKVEEKIDAPLLAIALVFCPMAIAEANRLRRHFDIALRQCNALLRRHSQFKILSEVIEKPFVKILKAQILLNKADSQYKARALAASPAIRPDGSLKYQGLEAAETYQGVLMNFEDQGQYVNRVNAGLASMASQLNGLLQHSFHPTAAKEATPGVLPPLSPDDRRAFAVFGKKIAIETMKPRQGEYPEPNRRIRPHESLLKFEAPGAGETSTGLRETNPLVYALIVEARARLLQMESGLNYLGYSDEYVPPWRFQFLLERARYFAEHAKNAQREYLNFLANAEREEFQEQTAAQNVEMEKSNIRIETARVEQLRGEVESAKASQELARLTAHNAAARLDAYVEMDQRIADLEADSSFWSDVAGFGSAVVGFAQAAVAGAATAGVGAVMAVGQIATFIGQSQARRAETDIKQEQREFEKFSLSLAAGEAEQAAEVALRQLSVARAGLLVASMQRAAAVLRHEFALQNLIFLRNRTLNAELWYRLSAEIRSVANTYLNYGVEMAFLAEQAYEFEADKRINVIRFDYDASELGDMLAGDFLLRDLDTLEQDLIVGQKLRQQQVRYVLSLSREFPEALQELREHGAVTFSVRLEQLERRFPGLFNLRISAIEVLPLALMDATRFSLELTHLGSGQVRLAAQTDLPAEILGADWLSGLETEWPIRIRSTPPETAVFSGVAPRELSGTAAFFSANQRGAFEGLAAASAWKLDFSMKENRIVPDSLADVILTFTLSGFYDANLREAVEHAPRKALAVTRWFSGHHSFPDEFYHFNRTGRMSWSVNRELFAPAETVKDLRNVAVLCVPSQKRPELGRLLCSYPIEFELDVGGNILVLRELPRFSLSVNGLVLDGILDPAIASSVTFDFGDGSAGTGLPHTYSRPGRYDVLVRIARNGRLTEYRASVVVSRQHVLEPPCIVVPDFETAVSGGKVQLRPSLQAPPGESLSATWWIDDNKPDEGSGPVTFTLDLPDPGTTRRYVLRFSAIRALTARFYSQQRYVPDDPLPLSGLHLATNRTFDAVTGSETTSIRNGFAERVFGTDAAPLVLSPADRWTFELPLDDNPCLASVSAADVKQHELSELGDVVLALDYNVQEV